MLAMTVSKAVLPQEWVGSAHNTGVSNKPLKETYICNISMHGCYPLNSTIFLSDDDDTSIKRKRVNYEPKATPIHLKAVTMVINCGFDLLFTRSFQGETDVFCYH